MSTHFPPRWPRLLCGLVLLLKASTLHAQDSSAIALTLEQALAHAAERNPSLAAQRYGERAAEALIEQAGLRPNPRLEVGLENFVGTGRVQGVRGLETTVQASQTFERGGKREKRVAVASRDRDAAAKEFAVRRAEIFSAVATAYVETVAAQQRVTLAEEPLRLTLFDFTVVFSQHGEIYQARPLEIGRRSGGYVEVLKGLEAGERYVTENSFLIKADIGKSGASHDH